MCVPFSKRRPSSTGTMESVTAATMSAPLSTSSGRSHTSTSMPYVSAILRAKASRLALAGLKT